MSCVASLSYDYIVGVLVQYTLSITFSYLVKLLISYFKITTIYQLFWRSISNVKYCSLANLPFFIAALDVKKVLQHNKVGGRCVVSS